MEVFLNYYKTLKNIVKLQFHQGQNPQYIGDVACLLLVQDITSHLSIATSVHWEIIILMIAGTMPAILE